MIIKRLLVLITLIIVSLTSCKKNKPSHQFEVWQAGKVIDITCERWNWSSYSRGGVYYKYIGECDK